MTRMSKRIVVAGAGYAGMLFTMRLQGKVSSQQAQITLVNDSDAFTERPRMHQLATNLKLPVHSIPEMLRKTRVQFIQGSVTRLDPARRTITVGERGSQRDLEYDYLVYALGSATDRTKVPGVDRYAYTLAPRGPLSALALQSTLPPLADNGGHVVVAGGGATGIETAAEVASAYPRIKVRLVMRGSLERSWNEYLAGTIRSSLQRLGVEIIDGVDVTAVGPGAVVVDHGGEIPYDICIWTGGFVAPMLAEEAGVAVNARHQVIIDPFLRSISHPDIYAIGDSASPREDPGAPLRMAAVTAALLGARGADSLSAVLHGKTPKPLSLAYLGQGISLGRHNAIGFNNYPDDIPKPPYFPGRLGHGIRELFVAYLGAAPRFERRWPGLFVWPGKGRYRAAQRRQALLAAAAARN